MSMAGADETSKTPDLSGAIEEVETSSRKTETGTSSESISEPWKTDTKNGVTQTFPPSHILEDGRLIYLPPPNAVERTRFFERSIARHGLLQADMEQSDHSNESNKNKTKQSVQTLLEGDKEDQPKENGEDDNNENDKTAPKIHPLAVASARLQSNGLNELNRAINLATLVSTGEFFSYTNVVDPSYETDAAATVSVKSASKAGGDKSSGDGGGTASGTSSVAAAAHYSAEATAQRTEALFSLKRKRAQFEKASEVLERHEQRLWAGIQAQRVIDQRLFQLRQQWRLVAPEHGTRARLHAARTNEVIAVDVDVYDRDRVHGGNQALMGGGNRSRIGLAGRLASRVPRFATIELRDTFKVPKRDNEDGDDGTSVESKKDTNDDSSDTNTAEKSTTPPKKDILSQDEEMNDAQDDVNSEETNAKNDEKNKKNENNSKQSDGNDSDVLMRDAKTDFEKKENDRGSPVSVNIEVKEAENEKYAAKWTRAEPFAVADPTLGRVIENFDPSRIPMLNLQLDIQKSSTGFLQSACLEPMTTLSSAGNSSKTFSDKDKDGSNNDNEGNNSDEELLISLQHSLFCANLFESMRSELDPDSTADGHNDKRGNSFSVRRSKPLQNMAWLASESEENFVAPPSFLVGGHAGRGLGALSVVHCHEGEVKVQLDAEYQLCLKLVEANAEQTIVSPSQLKKERGSAVGNIVGEESHSGSQSPAQLHAFCRALLLYAQDVYHRHSLYLHEREKKMRDDEMAKGDEPRGLARIKKEDAPEKARILQSCVSLGSKMLFEQRIRKALSRVSQWLQKKHGEKLTVEWLSLSIFDLHSKFTLCCRNLVVDGIISRDTLTITKVIEDDSEDYRKVHFHTEKEFELHLKLELQRQMQQSTRD